MVFDTQRTQRRFAAVDLGAETGRVAVVGFDGDRLQLEVVHRFATPVLQLPDGLHWDVGAIFREIEMGLRKTGSIESLGVDAWGCDYAGIGPGGELLGLPFHYRDERLQREADEVWELVPRAELFARTGIQHLAFNTVYQLHRDRRSIEKADRILLIPDLMNYWLTGIAVNEETSASTTGLTDPSTRSWARDLIERLALPLSPFVGELAPPGVELGPVRPELGLADTLVRTSAGHDTAAAFAATPARSRRVAVISSGTWSLVGREVAEPVVTDLAGRLNMSNEWGAGGTVRLLKNVMGLWLLQELARTSPARRSYTHLERLAEAAGDDVAVFDPDDEEFLRPGDIEPRIAAFCKRSGQRPPATTGELVRSILQSLACKYRIVLDELHTLTDQIECIHVVGGGSQNRLLCQLTANVVGLPVVAGPAEATAVGNVLVQAQAAGVFASRTEARECVAKSFALTTYEPLDDGGLFDRFCTLASTAPVPVGI